MTNYPSYCCPKCGEQIGWLGRFFNFFIPNYHSCEMKPYYNVLKLSPIGKYVFIKRYNELITAEVFVRMARKYKNPIYHYVED